MFVVASIGMACGAGLYVAAAVAAVIVVVALEVVGFLERRASLKGYPLVYEARGNRPDADAEIDSGCDGQSRRTPEIVERDAIGELQRVSFGCDRDKRQHQRLRPNLHAEPAIDALLTFRDPEED